LASFARHSDFSSEGVKAVTVQVCLAAAGRQEISFELSTGGSTNSEKAI